MPGVKYIQLLMNRNFRSKIAKSGNQGPRYGKTQLINIVFLSPTTPWEKNLTILKFQGCFREVLGDVWRYFWTIFGDNFGMYLRGFGGILRCFQIVLGKVFRGLKTYKKPIQNLYKPIQSIKTSSFFPGGVAFLRFSSLFSKKNMFSAPAQSPGLIGYQAEKD